jgi:hypothetical protein
MQERYKRKEWQSIEGFVKGEETAADDERIFASLIGPDFDLHNVERLPSASAVKQKFG